MIRISKFIVLFILTIVTIIFTAKIDTFASAQKQNLALGTTAYLQDNSGGSLPPNADIYYASNAVDGNSSTYAQAGNSWAWTLHDDLGSVKTGINKVVVNFVSGLYATEYNILLSTDGTNWTTAASITGCTGGSRTSVLTPTDARYIRIRAIKPDGEGQTGVQMAIAELEVYNYNLALGTTAYLQDNNGGTLPPCEGIRYASNAVDGDSLTYAQAANSYAWTLHDDLGSIRKRIDTVVVNFASGYATEYNILLSSDGTNWTTVASITGCTGGSRTSFFTPTDARYVRIRAIKPDGEGQTGVQMTISELEVYNSENLVQGAAASILDERGENTINPLDTSSYASNAIDGNAVTSACAIDYLWTLHVDLGSIKTQINKVAVTFDTSRYATDYFVILSPDGTNWTRVTLKTNCAGGTVITTFNPMDARYVRIMALKPNGKNPDGSDNPNEPGVRMAIAELEVYAENDLAAPTVSMTKPAATTNVRNDTSVVLAFSETMDDNTLNLTNIQLKRTSDGTTVNSTYSVSDDKKVFTIFPNSYLSFSTSYTVLVGNTVKDIAGNPVTGTTSWSFTTETSISLSIETTSSTSYDTSLETSIYPAFVDNSPYKAWTLAGSTDYYQLKGRAGVPPYTWTLVSGALPTGLSLGSDGKISGTPTAEGTFSFRLRVTDSNSTTAEKDLVMEAKPYRSKWFTDAKFGFMVQWGLFGYPSHWNESNPLTGIGSWEDYITNFNANTWAQEIADRGGKVLNFTAMGGDDIRLWPSTTSTVYGYKTSRDIVGELITACHNRDIKFVAYLPGYYGWGGFSDYDTNEFTITGLHYGIISELIDKGVDGFWIDAGGSIGEEHCFNWDKIVPLIRTKNPDITIESNGDRNGFAYAMNYPYTDIVVNEAITSTDEQTLIIAIPNTTKKKMAIEIDNMLEFNWSWQQNSPYGMKSASAIINSIQQNWYRGATTVLSITPQTDGTFIPLAEKDTLDEIAAWVNANKNWCDTPAASLSDDNEYTSSQTVTLSSETGATIYYTTDGSIPTTNSNIYTNTITIDKSTHLKAIAVKSGKGNSLVMDKAYVIVPASEGSISLINNNVSGGTGKTGDASHETYIGMKILVGNEPLVVDRIGRYYMSGDTKVHNLKIVRVKDNSTVLFTSIDMSTGTADSNGFKYKRVAPVTLDAGSAYYIMSLEDSTDTRWNSDLSSVTGTLGARVIGPVWSDYTGTRYYTSIDQMLPDQNGFRGLKFPYLPGSTDNTNGQLLNIKFTIGNSPVISKNLVRGAIGYLQDNSGNPLPASANKYTADLALDNDVTTFAQAGNSYAWTLHVDLGNVKTGINKVVVTFASGLYATEYDILASTDGTSWTTAASITGCTGGSRISAFTPADARYIRIRAIKPDGPDQTGAQMAIAELEVYNDNIALGTTTALQDNNGGSLPPCEGIRYASNAVDGDSSTWAQAANSYVWTLHDDLGSVKTGINKVIVNFAFGLYATDYNILLSTDGTNWTTVASITGCTGGSNMSVFAPIDARYVRIRAIKPDGPNQTGVQMAITELEVYNDNLATGTTAALQDNNGGSLPPSSQHYASNAVDGDSSTWAQAANSYAWTLHDDLGSVKTGINKIVVNFTSGLYATEYNILVSTDGTNWTTAGGVINCEGGRSVVIFAPTDARYIRVRAIKPDGPNQTGAQMAITELEVYKQ